jgi:hypothetical protein
MTGAYEASYDPAATGLIKPQRDFISRLTSIAIASLTAGSGQRSPV